MTLIKEQLKRHPVYKMVKIHKPHCPVCGEMLRGENSHVLPYKCSCGTWRSSMADPNNYIVVKKDELAFKIATLKVDTWR